MILHGYPVSLLPMGLLSIAAWAFKTAVVVDHMRTGHKPFFLPATRQQFAQTCAPPDWVQIWLAHFRGRRARRGNFTTHYLKPRSGRLNDFHFYVMTFVVGYVAFQVLAPRWIKLARRRVPMPILRHDPDWDRAAVPIWPSDGTPVLWPPQSYLGDRSYDSFCYRWARIPL